jgi:hypothetical protein
MLFLSFMLFWHPLSSSQTKSLSNMAPRFVVLRERFGKVFLSQLVAAANLSSPDRSVSDFSNFSHRADAD